MSVISDIEFTCGNCGAQNKIPGDKLLTLSKSPQCGRCDQLLLSNYTKDFKDLAPESYIHPLDKETLDSLKRIPGVSTLLRSLIKHSFELATRIHHHANFVEVGPKQLPSLYNKFLYAAQVLGVKQLPQLYVYQDPTPNAYTFGVERYFVAISTGCLDLLDDDEVTCILAHELGHVHADHVLYKSAARVFGSLASTIVQMTFGVGSLVVYPIQLALLRWDRASELSSDRAALLVMKNPEIVIRTLMKVSGGSAKLADELNLEAFIEQADDFGRLQDEGPLGRYFVIFQSLFRSHPFPIWRTKEILDWIYEGTFLEILDGDYQSQGMVNHQQCHDCGASQRIDAVVCSQCGSAFFEDELEKEATSEQKSAIGFNMDPVNKAWGDVQNWYKKNFTISDSEKKNDKEDDSDEGDL